MKVNNVTVDDLREMGIVSDETGMYLSVLADRCLGRKK